MKPVQHMNTLSSHHWWGLGIVAALAFAAGFLLQNPALLIADSLTRYPDQKWNFVRPIVSWLDHSYITEGFGRRLLFGTLLYPVPAEVRASVYSIASVGVLLAFFMTLTALVHRISGNRLEAWRILTVASVSAAGAMNLGWLFGYFETYLHFFFALSIYLAIQGRVLSVLILSFVALLIHSSYLFYALPLVLAVLITSGVRMTRLLLPAAIILILVTLLFVYGNSDIDAMGASRGIVQVLDFEFVTYAVTGLYIILLFWVHWRIFSRLDIGRGMLFWAPYSSLLLFVMGVDYMRWITMLFVAVILSVLSAMVQEKNQYATRLSKLDWMTMSILAIPVLGPIGNTRAFEALRQVMSVLL